MKIGIPKEHRDEERRAAASPDTVKRYKGMGLEPVVEAGAGVGAAVADQAYQDAGAAIGDEAGAWASDIVLKVQRPDEAEMGRLRSGQVLIGMLDPYNSREQVAAYAAKLGISGLRTVSPPISNESLYFTMSHKSACNSGEMRGRLSRAIYQLHKQATMNKLVESNIQLWRQQSSK